MKKIFLFLIAFSLFSLLGGQVFAANLQITTKNLSNGTVGVQYGEEIKASGGSGSYTFSLKSGTLPPGLTGLNNASDGKVSGTVNTFKEYPGWQFEVRVVDNGTNEIVTKQFTIFMAVAQIEITNPSTNRLPDAIVGESYPKFTFVAKGGIPPYKWTNPVTTGCAPLSSIGLTLSVTGDLTGNVLKGVTGDRCFGISVDGDPVAIGGTNRKFSLFQINIINPPLTIDTASPLSSQQKNSYYTAQLDARGGVPNYSWKVISGNLPAGLSLSAGGLISGTPSVAGTFTFKALVTDSNKPSPNELSKDFSITITEGACQCPDGTTCASCKPGTSLYCDGNTKTLIENTDTCQAGQGGTGQTGQTGSNPPGAVDVGKLEVNWPNSPLSKIALNNNPDLNLTLLIRYLYEWGISLGGFAAFIALIIAGFQYLTSVGNAGKMSDAMGGIRSAGLGLVLLLGSWLILNTINPQLTNLKMPDDTNQPITSSVQPITAGESPTQNKCTNATIYSGINSSGASLPLNAGQGEAYLATSALVGNVGSIECMGTCAVILYPFANYSDQKGTVPIYTIACAADAPVKDISPFTNGKTDGFGSVKVQP